MKKATITIQDEVKATVTGLLGTDLNFFYEKFGLFSTGYFFNPKFKIGSWDGKIRHFSKSGQTYLYLLPEILPDLVKMGYKLELKDQRAIDAIVPNLIDENLFIEYPHPDTGKPIMLRDYQVNAVNALITEGNGICLASTGAGKTLLAAALLRVYEPYPIKTITIVPDQNLIMQTCKTFRSVGLDTGEYSGNRKDLDHKNVVSTWQALQYNTMLMNSFDLILVDECLRGDTLITLSDYTTKPIKEVVPGDSVLTYNQTTQIFEPNDVVKLHKNLSISSTEEMYELLMDDGTILYVTGNHKILTTIGYIRADELTCDHDIISIPTNQQLSSN